MQRARKIEHFSRGPPKDHVFKIITKYARDLGEVVIKVNYKRTDDGQGSTCHCVTGELKNMFEPILFHLVCKETHNVSLNSKQQFKEM